MQPTPSGAPLGHPQRQSEGGNPQDPLRVQRRAMDPEDLLDMIRRNKAWIAGPALAGLVLAVVVAFLWPDTYVSTAVIRVVPPQVPANFVPTNIATEMSQRINSMAQTILSRGTLTSIIETYGLYPRQRQSLPLEDIIEEMRQDLSIGNVRNVRVTTGNNLTAFQISFAYENRYLAQKVTADLVTRFINENTRERANQSAMTTQFLRDQWQAAKNDLDAIEQELTEFRMRNAGQLPDQWTANVQQASALEARASSLNGAIGRLSQEKLVLDSEIRVLQQAIDAITKNPMAPGGTPTAFNDPRMAEFDQRIQNAERNLIRLLDTYTENHPDVQAYKSQIALLESERESYLANRATQPLNEDDPEAPMLTPAQVQEVRRINAQIQDKQIQIQAKNLEIERTADQLKDVNDRIQRVQARIERAPVGQQEYAALNRDYELKQSRYDDLNRKMTQSQIATDLENRRRWNCWTRLHFPSGRPSLFARSSSWRDWP